VATLCLASPHLFVVHKIVLRSFDELFTCSEGGTDERGGVSEKGLDVLEFFVTCGEGLGMGGEGGVGDGVSVVVGSGVGVAGCGRWRIRMLTAAVVAVEVAFTAGNDEGVGRMGGGCQRLVGGE
jgi:hypothetical protein